jgi:hypothetical protein
MRSARRLLAVLILTSPLALVGCKQGVGDRCQVASDCDDGLICVLPPTGTPQSGGTCQPPGGIDGNLMTDMAAAGASVDQSTTD